MMGTGSPSASAPARYQPPKNLLERSYQTVDYHTGGEPFRIVTSGVPDIPGMDVPDRRTFAMGSNDIQFVRRLLCSEPRGHADMYGGFLTRPNDDGAHFGVLFWHKDGFSTACGHGTIALGVWAVESGRVPAEPDGDTDVIIDVPSGRVTARVRCQAGQVISVTFVNVPSWVVARQLPIATSRGELRVDVSFGGAMYASLPAAEAGLSVTPVHYEELITIGREIKDALNAPDLTAKAVVCHPDDNRLSGIYGTIFYDDFGDIAALEQFSSSVPNDAEVLQQRNVTVFADGEVDRSPCGSGTCARIALLADEGRLSSAGVLVHDSIVGSRFIGRVAGRTQLHGHAAVLPEVTGMAYRTGESTFIVDDRDPLVPGFVLR